MKFTRKTLIETLGVLEEAVQGPKKRTYTSGEVMERVSDILKDENLKGLEHVVLRALKIRLG